MTEKKNNTAQDESENLQRSLFISRRMSLMKELKIIISRCDTLKSADNNKWSTKTTHQRKRISEFEM